MINQYPGKMTTVHNTTFQFLKNLSANNNREWFTEYKNSYILAQENMIEFVDTLITEINKHDELDNESGKKSLLRIYNDVRFQKDKAPYNPRFAFRFQRATKLKRGGYYVTIKPGNSFFACGFFGPNPEDLKRIRLDIASNYADWNSLLASIPIQETFGALRGNKVATSPKGYSKNHPAIELLRHKQFILRHEFSDKEVISKEFLQKLNTTISSARPFLDYMSQVLTTNVNGELIV